MDDRPLRSTSPNDQLDTVLSENTHEMIRPQLVGCSAGGCILRAVSFFFGGGIDRQTLSNACFMALASAGLRTYCRIATPSAGPCNARIGARLKKEAKDWRSRDFYPEETRNEISKPS